MDFECAIQEVEQVIVDTNREPVSHATVINAIRVLAVQVLGLAAAIEGIRRRIEDHDGQIATLSKATASKASTK